jgi:hypothetical protein
MTSVSYTKDGSTNFTETEKFIFSFIKNNGCLCYDNLKTYIKNTHSKRDKNYILAVCRKMSEIGTLTREVKYHGTRKYYVYKVRE